MESLYRILKWSEKYTKTDMTYLAKGGFWVLLAQIVTSISAFFLVIGLANLLSPEKFGEYRYVIAVISIISIVTIPGIDTSITRSVAKGGTPNFSSIIKSRMTYGLAGCIFTASLGIYYLVQNNESLAIVFLLTSIAMPLYGVFTVYISTLHGLSKFNIISIINFVGKFVLVTVMLLIAFLFQNVVALVLAFVILTIFSQYLAKFWTPKLTTEKYDTEIVPYGKYLTLIGTGTVLATHLDRIIVWHSLGAEEVAIYTVASLFALEGGRMIHSLNQIVLPRVSSRGADVDVGAFLKKTLGLCGGLFFIWITYGLLAPTIIPLFFPEYPEAVMYSVIASAAIIFAPSFFFRGYYIAMKDKKSLQILLLTGPLLKVIVLIALTHTYGVLGACLALPAGAFLELMLCIYTLTKTRRLFFSNHD